MQIKSITFQQTFPTGPYMNQKLGVEIEVPDFHPSTGESNFDKAYDAFKEAKKLVNDAFHAMNGGDRMGDYIQRQNEWDEKARAAFNIPSRQQPIPEINLEKEKLEIKIDNATTEDELWKLGTDKVAKYGLNEKFNQRLSELAGPPTH